MKILVTGGAGFVAAHLTAELRTHGHEVVLSDRLQPEILPENVAFVPGDLTKPRDMLRLVESVKPEAIVHLGAISFVPDAAQDLKTLISVNVNGTTSLLVAIRLHAPKSRFLFVSTSQVFGDRLSHYAASKYAAEQMVEKLGASQSLDWLVARPSNHTGPGQSVKFVVPSFVEQAVKIREGKLRHFTVGNLESVRDFTDVRDVVRAYRLILEKGLTGEHYTIGSNVRLSIGALLAKIRTLAGIEAPVEVDSRLWRPADASPILNVSKICALGWNPEIDLDQTLRDMISSMNSETPRPTS